MELDIFDRETDALNAALDEALELTFPASDPIAITTPKEASPEQDERVV